MAAPPLRRLIRPARRRAGQATGALLALFAIGYPLAGWIGSAISVNRDWIEPASGIGIMVETNGTHAGIIVPVVSPQKDWRETFPSAAMPRADGQYPTHLAIGWGEREVFLHVATWGDLRPATALRIALTGGDALIRVSHYLRPAPGENHRPVTLSPAQYARLVSAIEAALPPPPPGRQREILRGTYAPDAYYNARGTYTLIHTSNSWAGETLAASGMKMGWWTPFAGGVMKWIARPDSA